MIESEKGKEGRETFLRRRDRDRSYSNCSAFSDASGSDLSCTILSDASDSDFSDREEAQQEESHGTESDRKTTSTRVWSFRGLFTFILAKSKYLLRIRPRSTMAAYLNQIDQFLRTPGKIDEIFTAVEQKTKVQRKFIGLGGAFIAMGLIMTTLAPLVVNCIAFAYPAYKSIKALESSNKEDDTKWLTYWVVYGVFSVAEFFTDLILSWFPFYYLAKMLLFVWCMAPIQANGSQFIYSHVILPWFLKNEGKLDQAFDRSKKLLADAAGEAEKVAKQAASDALLKED